MAATDPTFVGFGVRDKHGCLLPGVIERAKADEAITQLNTYFKKNAPHVLLELHEPEGSATKLTPLSMLEVALGYVQNGSDEIVTIFQDDATYTYHIRVGREPRAGAKDTRRNYFGRSLEEVIEAAYNGERS